MTCPLCGYLQPDDVKECLQCHTPMARKAPDWRVNQNAPGEETDTIARIERRRRPRPRERTVAKERTQERSVAHDRRPAEEPRRPVIVRNETVVDKEPVVHREAAVQKTAARYEYKETVRQEPPPAEPSRSGELAPAGSSVTQLVDRLKQVIVTTTPDVQGRDVTDYKGVVTAGAVVRLGELRPYIDGIGDVGALRSAPFYEQLRKARDIAMTDLKIEAAKLGGNAVVGVSFQYEQSQSTGQSDRLIWIIATGTAVHLTD